MWQTDVLIVLHKTASYSEEIRPEHVALVIARRAVINILGHCSIYNFIMQFPLDLYQTTCVPQSSSMQFTVPIVFW